MGVLKKSLFSKLLIFTKHHLLSRDRIVEVAASSRCEWRKEPLKSGAVSSHKTERKRSRSPSYSRKRQYSGDHSGGDRGRYTAAPRLDNVVTYPGVYSAAYTRLGLVVL